MRYKKDDLYKFLLSEPKLEKLDLEPYKNANSDIQVEIEDIFKESSNNSQNQPRQNEYKTRHFKKREDKKEETYNENSIREKNRAPLSQSKSNLKKIKLFNDFNILNMQNNLNIRYPTMKREANKSNSFKNKNILKTKKDFTIKGLLNEKYSNYPEARHSSNPFDVISSYGVNTYKGIVRNYNEDRVSIIVNAKMPKSCINKNNIWPNISFFGIYDGHAGNKCAEYLKTNLHSYILNSPFFLSSPLKAIQNGFQLCENNFMNSIYNEPYNQYLDFSGSCAIEILIINDQCYIANLGDSRAIYSYNSGTEFYQLSRDHKPNDLKEKKRIYKAGGSIFKTNLEQMGMGLNIKESELGFKRPFRINPGRLAVSKYLIK